MSASACEIPVRLTLRVRRIAIGLDLERGQHVRSRWAVCSRGTSPRHLLCRHRPIHPLVSTTSSRSASACTAQADLPVGHTDPVGQLDHAQRLLLGGGKLFEDAALVLPDSSAHALFRSAGLWFPVVVVCSPAGRVCSRRGRGHHRADAGSCRMRCMSAMPCLLAVSAATPLQTATGDSRVW